MHLVTVRFTIRPETRAAFLSAMRHQRDASLQHSVGCRRFVIGHDGRETLFLYEEYDTPGDFARHLQTPHFREFSAATAEMVVAKTVEEWQPA